LVSYLFSQSIKELFFKSECKYRNIIPDPQNFFESIFNILFLPLFRNMHSKEKRIIIWLNRNRQRRKLRKIIESQILKNLNIFQNLFQILRFSCFLPVPGRSDAKKNQINILFYFCRAFPRSIF